MKFDRFDLTVLRFGVTHKSIPKQMFQPKYVEFRQSQVHSDTSMLHRHEVEKCYTNFQPKRTHILAIQVFKLASLSYHDTAKCSKTTPN